MVRQKGTTDRGAYKKKDIVLVAFGSMDVCLPTNPPKPLLGKQTEPRNQSLEKANISDVPVIAKPTPILTLQCEALVYQPLE